MARVTHATAVYAVADQFRERCLATESSLLWPTAHAWTTANLERLWSAFVDKPDESKDKSFIEKWREQLDAEPDDVHRIAADLTAFSHLFNTSESLASKMEQVTAITAWKLTDSAPELHAVEEAFKSGVGDVGMFYKVNPNHVMEFFIAFARRLRELHVDPSDQDGCAGLARSLSNEVRGGVGIQNVLLHLLFPDHFERIASTKDKERITKRFAALDEGATDLDERLRNIRAAKESELGLNASEFDFYLPDIQAELSPQDDAVSEAPATYRVPPTESPTPVGVPSLEDVAEATYHPPAEVRELEDLIRRKKQLIVEGPPGSGKTYVADQMARYLTGNSLTGPTSERLLIVQFHQSYGYEDFVQGIRPVTDGTTGALRYDLQSGVFKELCSRAADEPDADFVVLIDEINRGNISWILGELLYLLEYRNQSVKLAYSAPNDAPFRIPENVLVLGTMNTTDRSLAQIDYALRRRFYFHRMMPLTDGAAPVLARWLEQTELASEQSAQVLKLFVALNQRVQTELGEHFQIGHSYFMDADIGSDASQQRVWKYEIMPLLEEYFYNRRDRAELLASFSREALLVESVAETATQGTE